MRFCQAGSVPRECPFEDRGAVETAPGFGAANLLRLGSRVRPRFIGPEADEVTYPVHVILRYELEQALLSGALPVAELPEAGDQAMRSGLGIATGDDHRDGCMQDAHWAAGMIGYFPSCTLGATIAAQLMAAFEQEHPDFDRDMRRGGFSAMAAWLDARIWSRGSELPFEAFLVEATGRLLAPACFTAHLRRRYLAAC